MYVLKFELVSEWKRSQPNIEALWCRIRLNLASTASQCSAASELTRKKEKVPLWKVSLSGAKLSKGAFIPQNYGFSIQKQANAFIKRRSFLE